MIVNKVLNDFITPDHNEILKVLDCINPDEETQKIVMREKNHAQIFDGINDRVTQKCMDFEDKVESIFRS